MKNLTLPLALKEDLSSTRTRTSSVPHISIKTVLQDYSSMSSIRNFHSHKPSLSSQCYSENRLAINPSKYNLARTSNFLPIVQESKKMLSSQLASKNLKISSKLIEKSINASKLHETLITSRVKKASESQKYLKINILKAKDEENNRILELRRQMDEKEKSQPQKIANCLNKPGVTAWMRLASGGRLRASAAELPAPNLSSNLGNWEAFSGYLGPQKPTAGPVLNIKNHKASRGYCYKLDPIYKQLNSDQVVIYLRLRELGYSKSAAISLSHKVYCNLSNKTVEVDKMYHEDDDHYNELVKRFEDYLNKHHIRDGEIMRNDEEIYGEFMGESAEENEGLNEKSRSFKSNEKNKDDSEDSLVKSNLNVILREIRKRKKTKSLESLKIAEGEKESEEVQVEESDVKEEEVVEQDPIVIFKPPIKFSITSIKPKRQMSISSSSLESNESPCPQKATNVRYTTHSLSEIPESNSSFLYNFEDPSPKHQNLKDTPDIYKQTSLIQKAEQSKSQNTIKIQKHLEKKNIIETEVSNKLQNVLKRKLKKIKLIKELKKKKKLEKEENNKLKNLEFFQKVRAMQRKKSEIINNDAEATKKNYIEKLRRAEENKIYIEKIKERKLEELRNQYNSQRTFVEMLQSIVNKNS